MGTRIYLRSKKAPVLVADEPAVVGDKLTEAGPVLHNVAFAEFTAPGSAPGEFVGPVFVRVEEVVGFRSDERVPIDAGEYDEAGAGVPTEEGDFPAEEAGDMSTSDGLGGEEPHED